MPLQNLQGPGYDHAVLPISAGFRYPNMRTDKSKTRPPAIRGRAIWAGEGAPGVGKRMRPVIVPSRVALQALRVTPTTIVNKSVMRKIRSTEPIVLPRVTPET